MQNNIVPVILVSNDEFFLPYSLECTRGFFNRYIIYSIGSDDKTNDVITWWKDTNPKCEFVVKIFPMLHPGIQGCFRNSQIIEARSRYYLILDADELYTFKSIENIFKSVKELEKNPNKLYGVVRRIEMDYNLNKAYGINSFVPHHRIYSMMHEGWSGNHPGEYAAITANSDNEMVFTDVTCYHFHNCERSTHDCLVPKRLERRARPTYRPGELSSINIFEKLPILKKPIENFPVNPQLKILQDQLK